MRGREIVLLSAAVRRCASTSSSLFPASSCSSPVSAVPSSLPWASQFAAPAAPAAAAVAGGRALASGFSSSSHANLALSSSSIGDRRVGADGERKRWEDPRLSWLAAAGAFSTSFAFSSMSASLAKETIAPSNLPREVVLYQYEACPFCNKVKAFLDYNDIPYQVVEVNPMGKKEIKWSEYKKVPVLVVDGEQLNDSTAIITALNKRIHKGEESVEKSDDEEDEWRRWVDSHLVHMLSPNIYRSPSESLEAFDYIAEHGNFSRYERFSAKYFGAAAMYFISKRLKKRHNIVDERASLYEAADSWVQALNGRKYMGGAKPNLADLAVFGVLRPIRHLKSGEDMVANTGIGTWYRNMEGAVGPSSRLAASVQTSEIGKPVESTVPS